MTYYITCLTGIYSYGDFSITKGQTKEASKEVYDYCNKHFGTSGRFTFKTDAKAKAKVEKVEEVKIEEEVKTEPKRRKRSE